MTDFTGQYFDRYHILAPLGEGGMAAVYKAYDTRLERDVAVKIIRNDMFIPSQLEKVMKRFEREAKSLARLSHPNIVSIIDYGDHEGVPYLVMEYLPGGTLKDRLQGQPLPWPAALRLLLPIARALQFSHDLGIIHRDVKPSNILITLSGEPMLSDFGIARILEGEGSTALTGTGVGIGTPEYMAPEQWIGKTSPQSDLYSLGVVLFEMVTGCKPYTAETPAAILLKQASDPLPRPRQFVPDLPDRMEKIIIKALAKKPENRYSSMDELIDALEGLLSGQIRNKHPAFSGEKPEVGESARPESEVPPEQKKIVDQPTLDARLPAKGKPGESVFQVPDTDKTRIVAPKIPYGEALRGGKFKIHPAWIIALVGLVAVIAFTIWGALSLKALLAPAQTTMALAYNMPGSAQVTYFTSNQSGRAEVFTLDSKGKIVQVTHTPGQSQSWSPVRAPGGVVYFTSNQSGKAEIYYLDSKGKIAQVTQSPGQSQSWSPVLAPGGVVYFTSNQSGKAEVYYLDSKGQKVQVTHTPDPYGSWSPVPVTGGYVYFTSNQSKKDEIYFLGSKGKIVQVTHTPESYESWSPALASDGVIYYTSNQSGKAEVYCLDSKGQKVQVTHTPGLNGSWSPAPAAGGYIYFTSNQSLKEELYYMDKKGHIVQVTHTPGLSESWILYLSTPDSGTPQK